MTLEQVREVTAVHSPAMRAWMRSVDDRINAIRDEQGEAVLDDQKIQKLQELLNAAREVSEAGMMATARQRYKLQALTCIGWDCWEAAMDENGDWSPPIDEQRRTRYDFVAKLCGMMADAMIREDMRHVPESRTTVVQDNAGVPNRELDFDEEDCEACQ